MIVNVDRDFCGPGHRKWASSVNTSSTISCPWTTTPVTPSLFKKSLNPSRSANDPTADETILSTGAISLDSTLTLSYYFTSCYATALRAYNTVVKIIDTIFHKRNSPMQHTVWKVHQPASLDPLIEFLTSQLESRIYASHYMSWIKDTR